MIPAAEVRDLEHSPLGFSGGSRYSVCTASVGMSQLVREQDDDESEFSAEGTAVHAVVQECMVKGLDAWTFTGKRYQKARWPQEGRFLRPGPADLGVRITKKQVVGAQLWLDLINTAHPRENRFQGNFGIEDRIYAPSIHPYALSCVDFWFYDAETETLHVWDFKNGAGIVVEAEKNFQTRGYGSLVLEKHGLWDIAKHVEMHIVQPNAFHWSGKKHRSEKITTSELREYLDTIIVPAMDRAMRESVFKSGEHCRFCPARGNCPQMLSDAEEYAQLAQAFTERKLTVAEINRALLLRETGKIFDKQLGKEAFGMMNAGTEMDDFHLVRGISFRKWRDEEAAEKAARAKFGDAAMKPAELKSPAQIEDLPGGTAFAAEHAEKPEAGLTIAPKAKKGRQAVNAGVKTMFQPIKKGK